MHRCGTAVSGPQVSIPKPVPVCRRHALAATCFVNSAVLIAIAAVLNAITGLCDAYERTCGCTYGCAGESATRVTSNGSSGKPANRGTANTIAGCSSFVGCAPARSGANYGHRQDAVQDHSHRNILPILIMPIPRYYIGCILKGQGTHLRPDYWFFHRKTFNVIRGKSRIFRQTSW